MAIDFIALLAKKEEEQAKTKADEEAKKAQKAKSSKKKEKEEVKETVEIVEIEAQEEISIKDEEIVEETPKASQIKENKRKSGKSSLEEQLKNCNEYERRIADYLLANGFQEKMEHPDVSIYGMMKYVVGQAKKRQQGGYAMIDDAVVYGWAVHYYDECGRNL